MSFSRDVRPILSKHCYACHGPDESKRDGGFRLDVPNRDIDFDLILERIESTDSLEVMPPPSTNKPLGVGGIATLQKWISEGGQYEEHWAFVPPKQSSVPEGSHPVDHFIDRKLDNVGLKRSPPADPATLIRRLYLDLIGIPPTIEQADAYIDNPTPANYARIVDDLFNSPRYGERWARRWLDLARYADTNGYEKDRDRSIWPYRDWVIRAYNSDMPFDQFTIQQLAGDMLPDPTPDQIVATGFHRNTMLNEEGGIDPLEYRYYAMVDRVGTTGTTWLGLTLACAQCHTHKYDPVTHQDYFGVMAYLNNTDEPDYFLPLPNAEERLAANRVKAQQLREELVGQWPKGPDDPEFDEAFDRWLEKQKRAVADWKPISPTTLESNLPNLKLVADRVILATGDTTKHDVYRLGFSGQEKAITAIRLEALPDDRLPGGGPGLTYFEGRKGDFFLSEFQVLQDGEPIPIGAASESYGDNQFGNNPVSAKLATDGDVQSGWSVAKRIGERHVAVFNLEQPLVAGREFTIQMDFGRHFPSSLGKFRLSVATAEQSVAATALSAEQLDRIVQSPIESRDELSLEFAMQSKPLLPKANAIRRLERLPVGAATLVMRERPTGQERKTQLHHRGEYTQPNEDIDPRLPSAILKDSSRMPKDRLEFARWIVSKENPLTARVVANRQWHAFFGTGLVATVDDFGMQGESPSHPELLDYLAVELMNKDWSLKQLQRLIVTSKAYQQDSILVEKESHSNRLLFRFPRKRLEAEIIRDVSLSAAGILNTNMFGPPVRPIQPDEVAANFTKSKWKPSEGDQRNRRSIYTYQKRTAPFAMFTTFDAGSGESCLARRDASNTPLQALTLLNDPMFVDISKAFGRRIESVDGDFETKATTAFRWLMTRKPDESELEMLKSFYEKHESWAAVARVLLCLDEAITKN
jgi:hypothetical protein